MVSSPFKPFRLQVAYGRWRPHLNRYLPYWQISMEQFIVFNIWIFPEPKKRLDWISFEFIINSCIIDFRLENTLHLSEFIGKIQILQYYTILYINYVCIYDIRISDKYFCKFIDFICSNIVLIWREASSIDYFVRPSFMTTSSSSIYRLPILDIFWKRNTKIPNQPIFFNKT